VTTVGLYPYGIYVNTNNTVYVTDPTNGAILVWLEGNITPTTMISGNLLYPVSLFVSSTGDIYIGNGYPNGRVDGWILNTTTSILVMSVSEQCYGLFVDINDTLYCSIMNLHQVIAKSLNSGSNTLTIIAGTGCADYTSDTLNYPRGIVVDINFDLYVADCGNNRIQRFQSGQQNGSTVVGTNVPGTISLNSPTGVVLDADNYLYIVDSGNHRIVGAGPSGFRCIVGCFGAGSTPNQLYYPQSMSFDSYGNIFVTDQNNNRIQKFILATNSCSKYTYM
jgi:hypothetical protein